MTGNTIIIHRAANEIGGNCIEISSEKTRILLDFGLPLSSIKERKSAAQYRINIAGAYKDDSPGIKAVFLTHAHPDHCGLLEELNPEIPVYAAPTAILLLKNIAPLFGKNYAHLHFIPIKPNETVTLSPINVKALPIDHSIPQSYAYQITVNGKKILYTGDLRAHGKCSRLTEELSRYKSPDYLLLEGTTLNRTRQAAKTENSLLSKTKELFRSEKLSLISFSAQNLDRFVSVYKAARSLGKNLVIDPYTCFVLEQFSVLGKNIPQWHWPLIRVYFVNNGITRKMGKIKYRYKDKKVTIKEILKEPSKYVIKDNLGIRRRLLGQIKDLRLIHSAWPGYLEGDNLFAEDAELFNLPIEILHTSGHADFNTLSRLVREIKPRFIIPVHTERAKEYEKLFKKPTILLKDGEVLRF